MPRITAEQKFLRECNGNRTVRIFGSRDYQAYKSAMKQAKTALRLGKPFYATDHAKFGTMAHNGYVSYHLETAAWAVWVLNGAICSEYGSRQIENARARLQYSDRSYLKAWTLREWVSPTYSIGEDQDVHIIASWNVQDGMARGRAVVALVFYPKCSLKLPLDLIRDLPEKLIGALLGSFWTWPKGVLEKDAESIVRARAEEIAELLPALAVILVSA